MSVRSRATRTFMTDAAYEYIVVGSGPGGGTLAARLAEAGRRVLLLEAGGDPHELSGGDALNASNRLPGDYDVPAFHAFASENDALAWHFFVGHHDDKTIEPRDPNFVREFDGQTVNGFYYPRAGTLGGCSAHNAMIFVAPHDSDWDGLARLTGDATWRATYMRRYFKRLEECRYRPLQRWLGKFGINPSGHGWNGWLPTELCVPMASLNDERLDTLLVGALAGALKEDGHRWSRLRALFKGAFDGNDWRLAKRNDVGARFTPLTTNRHARIGTRERIRDVQRRFRDRLTVQLNALATRVLFDRDNRAIGVEYLRGERLYRAHARPNAGAAPTESVYASREVILSGGAFNSPQLLMLSGIGPADHLRHRGVPVRMAVDGVGRHLQDRYEVGVINEMAFPRWSVYEGARFATDDPLFAQWQSGRAGVYASNGSVLTITHRSPSSTPVPNLFCMALLGRFEGYKPGYSKTLSTDLNYLTWVVLKAHTTNRGGTVRLRSNDPRDTPVIEFSQFSDGGAEDVAAVVEGIRFVRRLTRKLKAQKLIAREIVPDSSKDSDAELRDFVRTHAWGHHACGTCAIGSIDDGGVLTTDFRVHGTRGLRVVDASVFPRIPGFFIVSAVYMIAEKAADVILRGETRT
jgi:choline dehydrogenase-like flavoprotein